MKTYLVTYSTVEWPRFVICLHGSETALRCFVQQLRADGSQLLEVQVMEVCV